MAFKIGSTRWTKITHDGVEIELEFTMPNGREAMSMTAHLASIRPTDDNAGEALRAIYDLRLNFVAQSLKGWKGIENTFPSTPEEVRDLIDRAGYSFVQKCWDAIDRALKTTPEIEGKSEPT